MSDLAREILPVTIEDELKQSYLDYAMSVIVGRALPDVRDGLKPVHRRVLFAMSELGNDWNKAHKKSARVVGDVIGKYHPHGDSAVYDTIVRMAQSFSLRYPLIDGQGNFGSVDGDRAAQMRYTEIRMARIAHEMLADIDKETVDFVPNYDESEHEPSVLPARIPNLLINGSSGIAVGMATNMPPHNLKEVVSACLALIDNPDLTVDELMEYIPGPDFPTGAIINGRAGIVQAYRTGRGRILIRARAEVEYDESTKRERIIVHEIPYQVNKAKMIINIAELVKDKRLEGISDLRDESDKDGLRVVIEVRRDASGEVVLNNLYQLTQMQVVFGINQVALLDGQPKCLDLRSILNAFLKHRREVVTRRTIFELRKARERGHVLEGLAIALVNIDPVIELIKQSANGPEAKAKLVAAGWAPGAVMGMLERAGADACKPEDLDGDFGLLDDGLYHLTEKQAQAILDLKLQKLTGLEHDKLLEEYRQVLDRIVELGRILADPGRLMEVIREELEEIREQYGDERRTEIIQSQEDLSIEDLIEEQDMVVTVSRGGYAKTQPIVDYRAQRRGGRGKSGVKLKEEDTIEHLLVASTHATILCFSNSGKVYWLKVFQIPQASRGSRGRPLVNLLPLEDGEWITAILPVEEYTPGHFILMATEQGTVKKTELVAFSRQRSVGLIAVNLNEGDRLIGAQITDGRRDVMLFATNGQAIRFKESDVRAMGRVSTGVRGMRLKPNEKVISLIIPEDEDQQILVASENGYGKRTLVSDYRVTGRSGQGVRAMKVNERNGRVIDAVPVKEQNDFMLITDQGTLVRSAVSEVSLLGRDTQGVTLIRLGTGEKLVGIEAIEEPANGEGMDDAVDAVDGAADSAPETE